MRSRRMPRRITTAGAVTSYTAASVSGPDGITAGPDGALWFTDLDNNSISRITTSGSITTYTKTGIFQPISVTAGPDGALWFSYGGLTGGLPMIVVL